MFMLTRFPARVLGVVTALALLPASLFAQPQFDRGPELDKSKDYYAALITNHGTIEAKLYDDQTPETVKNFVNLAEGTAEFRDVKNGQKVKRPFYNGTRFHRVIPEFMIQGGDPTATGTGGPGYKFRDEFVSTLNFDKPGLLAMANSGPATNGSQFFITEKATPWLNQRHTIFGEVVAGTDGVELVKKIARVERDAQDKPRNPVVLERVVIARVDQGATAEQGRAALQAAIKGGATDAATTTEASTTTTTPAEPTPAAEATTTTQ